MKIKTKLLIAIGFIAALCIGFLAGISVDYPRLNKSDVAGTFGKAEKYRKAQMTEKDIQLRSELVKDTAKLKSMIQGLVYFSLFTEEFSTNIDASIIAFKTQGLESDKIKSLQDYSDFIKNNNEALKVTIDMLSGFYLKDTADMSWDVEKSLKDFGTYVNNLNEKNTVLSQALRGMDNFMFSNKTLQANKTEIAQLKSIRDQLLIKSVQNSGLLCNKEQADNLINYAFESQEKYALFVKGIDKLDITSVGSKIQYNGQESINLAFKGIHSVGAYFLENKDFGAGLCLVYDKSKLQFGILDKGQMNSYGSRPLQQSLDRIAIFGTEELNILLVNYSLQEIISSQVFNNGHIESSLLQILSMDNLQTTFMSTQGLNYFINMINQNIGVYVEP